MKAFAAFLIVTALIAAACGGDGDSILETGGEVIILRADADRVAHAGLPTIEDLPGSGWEIVGQDQFSEGGNDFLESIQGNPECETLENLAALESVFGGRDEEGTPAGQAQVEFEQQDANSLVPTNVDIAIKIDEDAVGSRAQFEIVKGLFESDETSDCMISVLNAQFSESGPSGLEIDIRKGSGSADVPQDGVNLAFDVDMSFAGIELPLTMQLYFWPYGNANVQALILGTVETLDGDLISGVLEAVDANLKAAAGQP